jgi:hypothetical protein
MLEKTEKNSKENTLAYFAKLIRVLLSKQQVKLRAQRVVENLTTVKVDFVKLFCSSLPADQNKLECLPV